uniref:Uncharacterized protein n=1 Tax=Candidatus Kentrum sp. LPFa TaxID=2126335 RepID=A0A450W187_9GAMM|nr:MAG: hypothetical protein BECKLPF1236B_GA0070989_10167 [Candidatus Kentron sp. LPFa]
MVDARSDPPYDPCHFSLREKSSASEILRMHKISPSGRDDIFFIYSFTRKILNKTIKIRLLSKDDISSDLFGSGFSGLGDEFWFRFCRVRAFEKIRG